MAVHYVYDYVQVLAATQTPGEEGKKWFQGTADAVRQFHWLFEVSCFCETIYIALAILMLFCLFC